MEKEEKKCFIIDIAIPDDNTGAKEEEKIQGNHELHRQIKELWSMKRVGVVPVVIGGLDTVSKKQEKWIDRLGIKLKIEHFQKTSILGTARILRKILES